VPSGSGRRPRRPGAEERRAVIARKPPEHSRRGAPAAPPPGLSAGGWALLLAAFLGAVLSVYEPALDGPFVSDDFHYVRDNPYIHELSAENLLILFDPLGPATITIVNYSPVQLLLHGLAWQAFGAETFGHHLLNVVLHALASALLVALLLAAGIPRLAAILGGVFFLLHPANVEAVAWISQLKSTLALVLSLLALLAYARRPGLASAFFVLALLAKPTAAFALPVAALLDWARAGRMRWGWLALWTLLLLGYAAAEFATHQRSGAVEATLHATPLVLLRTVAGISLRYLLMAATSYGVSAFHEPEPAFSLLDPWWLGSVPVLALLGWRVLVVARRRDAELAFWVWAVVSFAPISQIFPFLYPMADRYLYFILPGLIGGTLLAGREALERLPTARRQLAGHTALALGIAAALIFGMRSFDRAGIWRSNPRLIADAALHYPDGMPANIGRAKSAGLVGDAEGVIANLRRARDRGYNRFEQLEADPAWASVRNHPEFRALVHEIAGGWIERARHKPNPTQIELRAVGHAHIARSEHAQALEILERALEMGGPRSAEIGAEVAALRAAFEAGAPERVRLGASGGP
jgi:hypothetical protein